MTVELLPIVQPFINSAAPNIVQKVASHLKRSVEELKADLGIAFGNHLALTVRRCSHIKTIISNETPVPLEEIYVNLILTLGPNTVMDSQITEVVARGRSAVVVGTAGAGKTMMMRYLALTTYRRSGGKIPLFVQLRDLKDPGQASFIRSLFSLTTPPTAKSSYNVFHYGLKEGLFFLLLDGLDEVPPSARGTIFQQIQRFHLEYPDSKMIASTRPEVNLANFDMFDVYKIAPLQKQQTIELIGKTPYHDLEKRGRFVEQLQGKLYDDNQSFLSIPLLALLLLLIKTRYSEIPSQASEFYEQAFDTLFQRHDASKGVGYIRPHLSGLAKKDFRRLFGMVCFRTLARHEISFSDYDLATEIERCAAKIELPDVDGGDVVTDLLESISLMHRDGLQIHFIHRSFQEYFAARFILSKNHGKQTYIVFDKLARDATSSNVPRLLMEMDRPALERDWLLPSLRDAATALLDAQAESRPDRIIRLFFDGIVLRRKSQWLFSEVRQHEVSAFERRLASIALLFGVGSLDPKSAFAGARMHPPERLGFITFLRRNPQIIASSVEFGDAALKPETLPRIVRKIYESGALEFSLRDEPEKAAWIEGTEIPARGERMAAAINALLEEVAERVARREEADVFD